jgi:hypothetical protein
MILGHKQNTNTCIREDAREVEVGLYTSLTFALHELRDWFHALANLTFRERATST